MLLKKDNFDYATGAVFGELEALKKKKSKDVQYRLMEKVKLKVFQPTSVKKLRPPSRILIHPRASSQGKQIN